MFKKLNRISKTALGVLGLPAACAYVWEQACECWHEVLGHVRPRDPQHLHGLDDLMGARGRERVGLEGQGSDKNPLDI